MMKCSMLQNLFNSPENIFNFFIAEDGTCFSFGSNSFSQLGTGNTKKEHRPIIVKVSYTGCFRIMQPNNNLECQKVTNLSRCNVCHLKVQSFLCLMICSLDLQNSIS